MNHKLFLCTLNKNWWIEETCTFFTADTTSKCFDVSMYKPTSDFGWSFGHCSGSGNWQGAGIYTDKCCVSEGWHILTCSINSLGHSDWSRSPLMMLGHTFCDDFVGHVAFIALNISGECKFCHTRTKNIHFFDYSYTILTYSYYSYSTDVVAFIHWPSYGNR